MLEKQDERGKVACFTFADFASTFCPGHFFISFFPAVRSVFCFNDGYNVCFFFFLYDLNITFIRWERNHFPRC